MYKFKRINFSLAGLWEPLAGYLLALAGATGLLFFRLGTLVPGLSLAEAAQPATAKSLTKIANNPLNAPFKLWLFAVNEFGHNNIFLMRTFSALAGLLTIVLFYYVVSRWTKVRQASLLGTALFATSSWLLHYSRLAIPDTSLLLLVTALAYGTWIRNTQRSMLAVLLGFFIGAGLIYVPGLVWFVIIGGFWQRRALAEHIKQAKLTLLPVMVISVLLIAPLAYALSRQPSLANSLMGLPSKWPSPYDVFRHILNVPFQIYARGLGNPVYELGRLPLVDVFTAAMSVIGIYSYYLSRGLDRSKLIAGSLVIGTILVGLRGSASIVLLLPFIYFLVPAGIAYLWRQWFSVFPKNPLARTVGGILITVAVLLSCLFNLRSYFIAWPATPATKQAFSVQLNR